MKRFLFALALTAAAHAVPVVTNGGFETGNFNDWELSNPTGSGANVVANQAGDGFFGSFHGLITLSGSDPKNVTSVRLLEDFLGLPDNCLDDDAILFGTAIRQVVTVNDLQDLSLLYNFLTDLTTEASTLGTFAYFTIGDGTTGSLFDLGDPFAPSEALLTSFPRDGFFRTYNITDTDSFDLNMSDNGPIIIGLVLASSGATVPAAGLAFDNVLITPETDAPEISASGLAQALPMLLCLVLLSRRRR